MKPRIFFFTILTIILAIGFFDPNGIRAAVANNAWSIKFIRQVYDGTPPDQMASPPSTHLHAGMLLAQQALTQDDLALASAYITPVDKTADRLVLDTYAQILYLEEDYQGAIEAWKNAGNARSLRQAGTELIKMGNPELGFLGWQAAYDVDPVQYTITYAHALKSQGDYHAAIALIKQSVQDYPGSNRVPLWYKTMGDLYQDVENYPEAAQGHFELAEVYWENDQSEQADQAIAQAIQLDPDNLNYHLLAGQIFEKSGSLEKALHAYETVLRIDPNQNQALEAIERLSASE